MAPSLVEPTNTEWSTEFDTVRREKLFRNPPKDRSAYPRLREAVRPHVGSFDAIFENQEILKAGLEDIGTKTFLQPDETADQKDARELEGTAPRRKDRLRVTLREVFLEKPQLPASNKSSARHREIYPAECRERHATYKGRLRARLEVQVNNGERTEMVRDMGLVPIMLRSNRCHLEKDSPEQLVHHKEESDEQGGYFIVNGNEKLIRMLVVQKRNYPMAIVRNTFVNRGNRYTKFGIQVRSVRPDQTSQTNVLHYLKSGDVMFRFSWRKKEYLLPVVMILKALVETNDRDISEQMVGSLSGSKASDNIYMADRVEMLLRANKVHRVHGRAEIRAYLGKVYKHVLDVPADTPNVAAGTEFLRKIVLVHLGNVNVTESQDRDKFNLILFMIRKLYSLVSGDCATDNPDAVSSQEILLGGFLYAMIIKERLEDWLNTIQLAIRQWSELSTRYRSFTDPEFMQELPGKIFKRTTENIGQSLEHFLSTGNLSTSSGLDLQQVSGFTIVAEKINFYRFMSHFRMVHRGSFFAQLRTTTVRKLLPESWGFLCPVHTPDGSPCGLLNHLAHECRIMTNDLDVSAISPLLVSLGVVAASSASTEESVVVQLDGKVMGYCSPKQARIVAETLRYWKVEGSHKVPIELEVALVPNSNRGLYPGLFLFSQAARMVRPVKYLPLEGKDFVGPFEQQFMSIACRDHEIESGESTHVEIDITNILSIFANQTPFSDHNQSPRNMYQCQMAKQTMGTPGTSTRYRTDNKSYRLQSGQTPVVRPPLYNQYGLDNYPNGMNAVVAVISYTGYDMDDAMIINKLAHERGFGYGTIYKTKIIRLDDDNKRSKSKVTTEKLFGFAPNSFVTESVKEALDNDGLPRVGTLLAENSPLYASHIVSYDPVSDSYINRDSQTSVHKYRDAESAYVEEVRMIGEESGDRPCQAASIKLRIPRSPVVGDKFSSRHGQKGVLSRKWPSVDMPFSESGIVPDVIINPHAFPSRMTIGMLVESLAGKSGALHGLAQDCSPWRFDDDSPASEFFGEQLAAAGYNYHGNEPMYSGITGEEFFADIYVGVVFYQRLRHMVNDKFQVRTTGPVVQTTGQPIKGRARGGGIRVGEMERDALLAHGAAFLLQDRLFNCSDYTRAWICRACGKFMGTQTTVVKGVRKGGKVGSGVVRCRTCARAARTGDSKVDVWEDGQGARWTGGEDTTVVAVPAVLRYLDVELASMGVKLKFDVGP